MRTTFWTPQAGRTRRGSTVILAVAILAVLLVLALSMSFSTRADLRASRNWANAVQSKMAVVSGVPLFTASAGDSSVTPLNIARSTKLSSSKALYSPLIIQLDLSEGNGQAQTSGANAYQQSKTSQTSTYTNTQTSEAAFSLAAAQLLDTSAQININAVIPANEQNIQGQLESQINGSQLPAATPAELTEEMLANLIDQVAQAHGLDNVNPGELAHQIALARYGADGQPGKASTDDNDNGPSVNQFQLSNWDDKNLTLHLCPLNDELDNDRDGEIDNPEESLATDGLDNDLDGQTDQTREGVDEPAEAGQDPRQSPYGDDVVYTSLAQLMSVPGMTLELYEALRPYLTIFSVSYAAFELPGNSGQEVWGYPQVDPNTASAQALYEVLSQRMTTANPDLLGQFVANIIDRRDQDDVPTAFKVGSNTYYGLEMTPCINEVYCDSASFDEDGDDGQFIELYNPYSKTLSLEGLVLSVGECRLQLAGSLPAGGILVLTDDFNNENDQSPEWEAGQGSIYNIFGVVTTGPDRMIEEYTDLDIPNESGSVRLLNSDGDVLDQFDYDSGAWDGTATSFQRIDPRVQASQRASATPLAPNRNIISSNLSQALEMQERWQNQPFRCALDLMLVSTAFATQTSSNETKIYSWLLPELSSSLQSNLDVRLVDCFRQGAVVPTEGMKLVRSQTQQDQLQRDEFGQALDPEASQIEDMMESQPRCDRMFGRINLNTASAVVLASLPQMDSTLLSRIVEARRQTYLSEDETQEALNHGDAEWWQAYSPLLSPRWLYLSDLLLDPDVWTSQESLYERLDAVYPFYRLLCTRSMARLTQNVNQTQQQESKGPQQSVARSERIVTGDLGKTQTVSFRYLSAQVSPQGDPDLRYAVRLTDPSRLLDLNKKP